MGKQPRFADVAKNCGIVVVGIGLASGTDALQYWLFLQGVSILDQRPASEAGLAWPAADALQNWGILVVGRRRLTPVQLRDLRVDVLGGKAKSVIWVGA